MILTQLPDLPPRPETPRNAAFRRLFYSRWGKENWIVCGPGRHAEYAPYKQTFSIKTVLTGREHYYVDNRRLTVTDETYLLLNENRTYGSLLEAPQDAFSFSIFFRPGLAAQVADAAQLDLDGALDTCGEMEQAPVEFAEHLRRHDKSVTPVLRHIRRHVEMVACQTDYWPPSSLCGSRQKPRLLQAATKPLSEKAPQATFSNVLGVDDEQWYEEQFNFLLGRIMRAEHEWARLPERIDCIHRGKRREIAKRLAWATDFMHSNLHQSLTLLDVARAARLSHFHFLRLFRQVHGVTPMTYLRAQRTQRALSLLRSTQLDVAEVAAQVGMSRPSLWRSVHRSVGQGPRRARQAASTPA